jgi:polyphosphate kinase
LLICRIPGAGQEIMTERSDHSSDRSPIAAAGSVASIAESAPGAGARGARSRAAKPAPEAPLAPPAVRERSGTGAALAAPAEVVAPVDLRSPELYLNRELTWIAFNRRVLHEAQDPRAPLLERVKFLAIVSSNLDEFFMKRIGGLKQQVGAGLHDLTVDGRTPERQIEECVAVIEELTPELRDTYAELRERLREHDIVLALWSELSDAQREAARSYYYDNIFPLVTPLAMDPAHPFPFISNLSLNLLVTLHHQDDPQPVFARVKVPIGKGVPRYLRVGPGNCFVRLEEVMAHSLDRLFPGMEIDSCEFFRVTRNANTEREEEDADDLVSMIEAELRDRKFAPIVRLEVGEGIDSVHRGMLAVELGLDEVRDVFETSAPLGLRDLFEIAALELPALHDPVHHPVTNAKLEDQERNIFHIIRETGPILLQHPYESFGTSVERFVHEASRDPKVLAIKMTLYRTSSGTRIIDDLVEAARNGKQVAVVVEIKARFDEAANIQWANRLEEVGIHVMYGVVGLKTHSKVILVVRRDYTGIRRYAHIGTGNYHAGTARIYSDLGLLTCDPAIGQDLTELFNYLTTGYKPSRKYQKLLVAPKALKQPLLDKIEREIACHSSKHPGLIRFKMNALEDADIVRALYRSSQAGVRVELIVRDTCRLRPGLPGLSDNVTVVSILGRFLEHARIYYFRNGGAEEFFIGSADLMTRNLESRVEVVTPVEDPGAREELRAILDAQISDRRGAWEMQPDGSYVQRQPGNGAEGGSQQALITAAERRFNEANRLRKRRPQSIARRSPTERALI